MPYRDPHTAGPALWALMRSTRCTFEVSCIPVEGSTAWRKGLEAVAVALYRQETGRSPTANFGRMPTGYRMSSGNNRRLVAASERFRGGASIEPDPSHLPGVAPVEGLDGDPQGATWCGHARGGWEQLSDYRFAHGSGLYRIRDEGIDGLVYIGEGTIPHRLASHLRKRLSRGTPPTAQQSVFAQMERSEFAFVTGQWESHQRLELETDLIAAHMLQLGRPPAGQFLG
jgi:hypothetical protein